MRQEEGVQGVTTRLEAGSVATMRTVFECFDTGAWQWEGRARGTEGAKRRVCMVGK